MAYVKYESYERGDIGAELMNFFLRENGEPLDGGKFAPRTLTDFLDSLPARHRKNHEHLGLIIRIYCQKLINDGQLFTVGFNQAQDPPYNEQFFSYFFIDELAEYGTYDFTVLGFPKLVRHFENSVVKLIVAPGVDDRETTGTGFLMEGNRLVTAAHCLPEGDRVLIENWDAEKSPIKRITILGREGLNPFKTDRGLVDLAIVEFESDPFPDAAKFKLWGADTLDECLVMGYPSIPGLDIGLIPSAGRVVREFHVYLRNQNMMLVDARVKGGNSGGPVLNKYGKVMGVITNGESEDEFMREKMGFAIATPAQTLLDLINAIDPRGEERFVKDLYEIAFELETDNTVLIKG